MTNTREKFQEVSKRRMNNISHQINLLGNLSNRKNYKFEKDEAAEMFIILNYQMEQNKIKFGLPTTIRPYYNKKHQIRCIDKHGCNARVSKRFVDVNNETIIINECEKCGTIWVTEKNVKIVKETCKACNHEFKFNADAPEVKNNGTVTCPECECVIELN